MTMKIVPRLCLMMAILLSFYSCIHDDLNSSSDLTSKEYTNKSLWKEDETYIKNVMKVYFENESEIKKTTGIPYWDYATTVGSFDESFLMVPVIEEQKVVSVLKVPRHGKSIYFYYTSSDSDLAFFQGFVFAKLKKAVDSNNSLQVSKITCHRQTISIWMPDNQNNPSNSGHWESNSIIVCKQLKDECVGIIDQFGDCDTSTGDGGGYDYPGGGSEDPEQQEPEDPCDKTKAMLAKPNVQQGINSIKAQALSTLGNVYAGEIGFKEKKDGTIVPADVNSNHKVVYNDVTDGYGGYHNHTATGTHMFSPPDITETLFGFAAAQNNVEDAYFGMIAAEWCSTCPNNVQYIHYVIQYTGAASDLGIGGSYNFTSEQIAKFEKDYLKIVRNLRNTYISGNTYIKNTAGDLNEKGLEKLFFETLNSMNLAGKVNLQRIEANGTINNITLDSSNMPIKTPCL